MFWGKEIAERRRVMRKWVRGSEGVVDAVDDDEGAAVARERECARTEANARERATAAKDMATTTERSCSLSSAASSRSGKFAGT